MVGSRPLAAPRRTQPCPHIETFQGEEFFAVIGAVVLTSGCNFYSVSWALGDTINPPLGGICIIGPQRETPLRCCIACYDVFLDLLDSYTTAPRSEPNVNCACHARYRWPQLACSISNSRSAMHRFCVIGSYSLSADRAVDIWGTVCRTAIPDI